MCVDAALTARMSDGGEGELAAACVGVETPLLKVAWLRAWLRVWTEVKPSACSPLCTSASPLEP